MHIKTELFVLFSLDHRISESSRVQHTNIKLYLVVCLSIPAAAASHCSVYSVRVRVCMRVCMCVFDHCHYQLLAPGWETATPRPLSLSFHISISSFVLLSPQVTMCVCVGVLHSLSQGTVTYISALLSIYFSLSFTIAEIQGQSGELLTGHLPMWEVCEKQKIRLSETLHPHVCCQISRRAKCPYACYILQTCTMAYKSFHTPLNNNTHTAVAG